MIRSSPFVVVGSLWAASAAIAACSGQSLSLGTGTGMQAVDPALVSQPATACPTGYAHPNVCCIESAGGAAQCAEDPNAPFEACPAAYGTFADPTSCCPLDPSSGACVEQEAGSPAPQDSGGSTAPEPGDASAPPPALDAAPPPATDATVPEDASPPPERDATPPAEDASGSECVKASDCRGALPQLCMLCGDGASGCAHFECVDRQCTIAYCE